MNRENLGFLLAKASQRWNDLLYEQFTAEGFPEVRPSYGSVLIPLFEEDGLRLGEIAQRARLSKQTMTTLARRVERDGLVERRADADDGRAARLYLSARAKRFRPAAERAVAAVEATLTDTMSRRDREQLQEALAALAAIETAGAETSQP